MAETLIPVWRLLRGVCLRLTVCVVERERGGEGGGGGGGFVNGYRWVLLPHGARFSGLVSLKVTRK